MITARIEVCKYIFLVINKISDDMGAAKEAVRGGAPPHKNNLIGTAAVGGSKSSGLKMSTTVFSGSLLLLARSMTNRKLRLHLHWSRWNTALPSGWSWLTKRIHNFKQATQQLPRSNKETKTANRNRASPVTSGNGDVRQQRFPGNTRKRKLSWTQVIEQNLYSYWTDELIHIQKDSKVSAVVFLS